MAYALIVVSFVAALLIWHASCLLAGTYHGPDNLGLPDRPHGHCLAYFSNASSFPSSSICPLVTEYSGWGWVYKIKYNHRERLGPGYIIDNPGKIIVGFWDVLTRWIEPWPGVLHS